MMRSYKKILTLVSLLSLIAIRVYAAELSLPNSPLAVANLNVAPLVMLVMGRDHTLYYEAYNDASDVNGDGILDTQFKPSISYYGYFDVSKCYSYDKTNGKNTFVPTGFTKTRTCKNEGGGGRWSGNFLNYLTTSRIDALRKVLYGGLRKKDDVANPVLVRAYIPQDAHSWGKTWDPQVMASLGIDDISYYTDLDPGFGYFFANTSLGKSTDNNPPLLRVLQLPKDMSQPTAYAASISSVSFAGTQTQWQTKKINMPLVSNHIWQAKVNFSGNDQFKFIINGSSWFPSSNIQTQAQGDKWVVFDDSNYKYQILDAPIEQKLHIWNWVSRENPVAGNKIDDATGKELTITPVDYTVQVRVCVDNLLEVDCKKYGEHYQPIGLFQRYGEGDAPKLKFGLITGSYKNNTKGGVLRAKIGKMKEEINDENGQFQTRNAQGASIIGTLDALKVINFGGSSYSSCGWIDSGPISNGQCQSWGNPIAEMLYESLRYFAGAGKRTTAFGADEEADPGLVEDSWDDPYTATEKVEGKDVLLNEKCAVPVNLVISDVGTSYDSDQIPGTKFQADPKNPFEGDAITPDVSDWTSKISSKEGVNGKSFFIGEVLGESNKGLPTAKTVSNLNSIRGLSPMEPTKEGSYYSAGLAYYGHETDLNKVAGEQKPQTMVVAMASNLPKITIDVAGKKVNLVPFAKTITNGGDSDSYYNKGGFQPTNGIVDFYVEKIEPTAGTFRINFEDVEQGADHDMDLIVRYSYQVSGDSVTITTETEYSASGYVQHAGYILSGTGKSDGVYLDVRDSDGTEWGKGYTKINPSQADHQYYMDTINADGTPRGQANCSGGKNSGVCVKLPLTKTRTFKVEASASVADFLPSPLWYAAKWGSFKDASDIGVKGEPDGGEWDSKKEGEPDNYFLVTSANKLEGQLKDAFNSASANSRSATSVSYSSSVLTNGSLFFDSKFEAKYWSGNVLAYPITNGVTSKKANWDANAKLKALGASKRVIVTMDTDGSKRTFTEPTSLDGSTSGLSKSQIASLLAEITETDVDLRLSYIKALVNYLRGDRTYETNDNLVPILKTPFRERNGMLGDIVHSTPVYDVSAGDQQPFLIFGANDGMVHILNAMTGDEIFAYIPSTSYKNLYRLSQSTYDSNHRFFVDGTIKVVTVPDGDTKRTIAVGTFGLGAQGAWALDLTTLKGLTASSAADHIMWELTDSDSSKIGYMMNAPAIIPVTSGDDTSWVAIFGNGYNNSEVDANTDATGEGALLVADLLTGQLKNTLLTKKGKTSDPTGSSRPNGLTEPVAADSDLDGQADALYSGDLFGNVWKVDIAGKGVTDWKFETGTGSAPQPMFTATSRDTPAASQPITVRPSVAYHPEGGLLVMVGTGKYIETTDVSVENQTTQSVYGLWDKPGRTTTIPRSKLLQQTIESEINATPNKHRETSKNIIEWDKKDGWYLDLFYNNKNSGERQNSKILIRNTTAAFTTLIPSTSPCEGGGTGWYMEVDIYTGSNTNLVDHSALLDSIPSEPVGTIIPNPDGNKSLTNVIKLDDDKPPFESPATIFNTGIVSWQMLY